MKRGLAGFARWVHPHLALRCFSWRMGSGDPFTDYCSKTNYDPHEPHDPHAVFAFDKFPIFHQPHAKRGEKHPTRKEVELPTLYLFVFLHR